MKKKTIIFLSLIIFLVAMIATLVFWQSRPARVKTPAIYAIPADAEFILEIYNPFETGRKILQYPFWNLSDSISSVQSFVHDFNFLDSLIRNNEKTKEFFRETILYISSHPFNGQTQWLFLCNINNTIKSHFIDQFVVKANKDYRLEKIETSFGIIKRMQILDNKRFLHYVLKNNIWIASMHFELVQAALRTIEEKNGFTTLQDFEKLMMLEPNNTDITLLASLKSLLGWANRTWNVETILPTKEQFTVFGHFILQFDSLKIQAKGIQPFAAIQQIENELPEKTTNWKIESNFIPAEIQHLLSYHILPKFFNHIENSWLQEVKGCAHVMVLNDDVESHTWLILPVEDDPKLILNQLCDSVITDSLHNSLTTAWGYIKYNNQLNLLPFHTIDTTLHVTGIIKNRLIFAKTKESLKTYYEKLHQQTLFQSEDFLKYFQGSNNNKFSWLMWFKPFAMKQQVEINHHQDFIHSIILKYNNRKDFVRTLIEVNLQKTQKNSYRMDIVRK